VKATVAKFATVRIKRNVQKMHIPLSGLEAPNWHLKLRTILYIRSYNLEATICDFKSRRRK